MEIIAKAASSSSARLAATPPTPPTTIIRPSFRRRALAVVLLSALATIRRTFGMIPPAPQQPRPDGVDKVMVIGGTHGNEYTGVWCIKALEQPHRRAEIAHKFPSLQVHTILANPRAHSANQRFVDTDLNREFSCDKLYAQSAQQEGAAAAAPAAATTTPLPYETIRAQELNQILGPKKRYDGNSNDNEEEEQEEAYDVAIDLHSTTSNMGITLIIPEGDTLMTQGAAYVAMKCRDRARQDAGNSDHNKDSPFPKARCLMESVPEKSKRSTLASVAKHDFTIEVGPVPVGLLRHDIIEQTQFALRDLLEFLHLYNENANSEDDGEDWVTELFRGAYPSGLVPCYRAAPAKQKDATKSGKLRWPCDPNNPKFPMWVVHESVQDQDYKPVKTGDPLFVASDGTIIPYQGSHGDEVHLIFINEAGYYYESSGTGIGVVTQSHYDLRTGLLRDDPVDSLT